MEKYRDFWTNRWLTTLKDLVPLLLLIALLVLPNLIFSHVLATAILAFFLPGFFVLRVIPQEKWFPVRRAGMYAWSTVLSFVMMSIFLYVLIIGFANQLIITERLMVAVVSALSLSTGLISSLIKPFKYEYKISFKKSFSTANLLPYLFLIAGAIIPFLYNPYAQDNDGYLTKTIQYAHGVAVSLHDLRPLFPAMLAAISSLTHLTIFHSFLYAPVILFLAGAICFWEYIRSELSVSILRYAALGFLASAPVIVTEISITRPQVILLAFMLPLLILAIQGIKKNSIQLLGAGLLVSILLIPYHELTSVVVLLYFILMGYYVALGVKQKRLELKKVILAIIILAPYILILPAGEFFHQLVGILNFIHDSTGNIQLRLWFINSYTSIDGSQLGWPGIQAAYYYLYNGLLLYLFLIVLAIVGKKYSKNKPEAKASWVIPLSFLGFFLFFAEIAPRLGFYFLLNRTWPYIALAACLCAVPILKQFEQTSIFLQRLVLVGSLAVLCSGYIGIAWVARDNVAQVFPQEAGAIQYLSTTPQDSLILSNQDNSLLVKIYANRNFGVIGTDQVNSPASLNTYLINQEEPVENTQATVKSFQTIFTTINGVTTETVTPMQTTIQTTTKINLHPSNSFYFLYSMRKASGRNAERSSQYQDNTQILEAPSYLQDFPVVYQDSATIIYKIAPTS